jgi:DNA end-binding protein Ku
VPRSIWTGWVGFGLVLIPVRLFPATTPRDVRFHEFARGTGRRVRHRRVVEEEASWDLRRWTAATEEASGPEAATPSSQPELEEEPELEPEPAPEPHPADEQPALQSPAVSPGPREVEFEDVVKGYEVEPGRYVMLEREELEALRPTADRTIHIERFVPLDQIDPVYFERSYYLAPGSAAQAPAGAERAYGLLLAALDQAGRVGIGRFVMRTREYLAAVRPMDGVLGLETLFFSDEVRRAADVVAYGLPGDASGRELNVAMKLIEVMAGDWDPGEYADTYRERVMDLIRQKAEGLEPVIEEEPSPRPEVADLLAALRQSVDEARDRSGSGMKKMKPRGRRASG